MTKKDNTKKPNKPHPNFPLYAHASGNWAKKIRGKTHYFGVWSEPEKALREWLAVKDDLLAGRTPRPQSDGHTLKTLCNHFYESKRLRVEAGELKPRTLADYYTVCKRVLKILGSNRIVDDLRPEDFEVLRSTLAKTRGPVALKNDITRIRVLFKFAFDNHLIETPVRYGQSFRKPSQSVLRKTKNSRNKKFYDASEIRKMVEQAGLQMKAMTLLGINCGFGNADCGSLTIPAVNLNEGWINWYRPKTGVMRRVPLWAETTEALAAVLDKRKSPSSNELKDLVFLTRKGLSWYKDTDTNPVSKEFRKLLEKCGLYRKGVGFYALRHTFKTIGDRSGDRVAVESIMGHVDDSVEAMYRQEIEDSRLISVVECVRDWMFDDAKNETEPMEERASV